MDCFAGWKIVCSEHEKWYINILTSRYETRTNCFSVLWFVHRQSAVTMRNGKHANFRSWKDKLSLYLCTHSRASGHMPAVVLCNRSTIIVIWPVELTINISSCKVPGFGYQPLLCWHFSSCWQSPFSSFFICFSARSAMRDWYSWLILIYAVLIVSNDVAYLCALDKHNREKLHLPALELLQSVIVSWMTCERRYTVLSNAI